MKIILHLGIHKTASTFIQSVLMHNRKALRDQGVEPVIRDTHKQIRNGLRRFMKGIEPSFKKRWTVFLTNQIKKGKEYILISDENLVGDPASVHYKRKAPQLFYPEVEQRLLQFSKLTKELDVDIQVVLYTRKQETLIRSLYLDGLKYLRYESSLDSFLQACLESDFRFDNLKGRITAFVKDISMIPFESIKQGENEFLHNFFGTCSLDDSFLVWPNVLTKNEAISDFQASLYRRYASLDLNKTQKAEVRKWISNLPKFDTSAPKNVHSQSELTLIREKYKDDISYTSCN